MSTSPIITITIDGQRHIVTESDFGVRFWESYFLLEALNGKSANFRSDAPPDRVVADGLQKRWADKLSGLRRGLKQVTDFTTVINAGIFHSRLSSILHRKLKGQKEKLEVLARSTRSIAADDGSRGESPYAQKYAGIYGVQEESIPRIPIWMEIPYDNCKTLLEAKGKIPGRREGIVVRRAILRHDDFKDGMYVRHFCSARGRFASEDFGAAAAFLWQFRAELDQAIDILSSRHPHIPRADLTVAFLELCFLEFSIFDNIDVYQDAASADYSESSFADSFKAILPKEG